MRLLVVFYPHIIPNSFQKVKSYKSGKIYHLVPFPELFVAKTPNIKTLGWSSFRADMFGRTKISEPYTIFYSSHRYTETPDFSYETAVNGSHTYSVNESAVNLTVTAESGSKATMESFRVMPYEPGKSLQVLQSFNFAAPKTSLRQRVGYFSRTNGIYLEQVGGQNYFVLRSYKTGSVVETRVPQSEWNVEPLLGSGATDLVLDLSKAQILFIEIEWLGVGSVRVGFVINGVFITAHQFNHANIETSTYMTTATLPLRYEIENLAGTSGSSTLKQVCASVVANGGYDPYPPQESATRVFASNFSTDFIPLIAIRMASDRTDSAVLLGDQQIIPLVSANYEFELLRNPTTLNGSWTAYGSGNVEYNNTCTTFSGGTLMHRGYVSATNQSIQQGNVQGLNRFELQLGRTNSDTPISDVYLLCIRTLSGNGQAAAVLNWSNVI